MRLVRALGALFALLGLLLVGVSTATAQEALPPPVTDYANYPDTPEALLNPGCDATGVTGAMFSVDGSTPVDSLADIPEVQAGATVTMTWTGASPECVGSAISLVVKVATEPVFDQNVDQLAAPDGYNVGTLTDGPGSLSLMLPDLAGFGLGCDYQLDAIVGVPLQDVGPSGSDFSASVRGDQRRTTVFSWRNSAYALCVAQAQTTTTAAPTTTTSAAPTPASTTAPTTTSTAAAPATTASVPPSTTAAERTPAAAAEAAQASRSAQAGRTLPATGADPVIAVTGFSMLLLGLGLLVVGRRRQLTS